MICFRYVLTNDIPITYQSHYQSTGDILHTYQKHTKNLVWVVFKKYHMHKTLCFIDMKGWMLKLHRWPFFFHLKIQGDTNK